MSSDDVIPQQESFQTAPSEHINVVKMQRELRSEANPGFLAEAELNEDVTKIFEMDNKIDLLNKDDKK